MAMDRFESVHLRNFGVPSSKAVPRYRLEWVKSAFLPLLTGRWMRNDLAMEFPSILAAQVNRCPRGFWQRLGFPAKSISDLKERPSLLVMLNSASGCFACSVAKPRTIQEGCLSNHPLSTKSSGTRFLAMLPWRPFLSWPVRPSVAM